MDAGMLYPEFYIIFFFCQGQQKLGFCVSLSNITFNNLPK